MKDPLVRNCNGGPRGPWCGEPATYVVTGVDGRSQWFTCDGHRRVDALRCEPLADWLERVYAVFASEMLEEADDDADVDGR